MADRIHRVTLFKLPNKEHQEQLIASYRVLSSQQQRDGKPYILSLVVGPAVEDARSKGYTVVAKTEFASLDDMRWYDNECPAHAALKKTAGSFGIGPDDILSVYFEPAHLAVL
ncbi:hypothetical protein SODALDRAFT_351849 [Sodiomyces alkalinus F11]|uniref:Stress-response A/B barrel domain-containing protein n=1 Tax=Sodiomyces alkalinus (strain CBS 110278 / VKM F-3762 / F11) TaxID=1314773 RepID=A0A3N2PSZ2_SODAK|nr:hypothetical protein SODALDRAFT_351849 [Sodiomyces alkalinus F11]ROT37610.1 hypothetical protein SODALDRAFT_351849 [Sodiomyces alkalinus F11]